MEESQKYVFEVAEKWEKIIAYVYENILRDMNKNDRFTLGQDMRVLLWDVAKSLKLYWLKHGNRREHLQSVDVNAKILLSMVRVGIDIKAISKKRQEPMAAMLDEIGRMVGRLLNPLPKNDTAQAPKSQKNVHRNIPRYYDASLLTEMTKQRE